MNHPRTKSMFSTGHSMSQCQQNSVMCSVCNRSWSLRFILKNKHLHKNCRLKFVHSTVTIENVYIIEFHVRLKVKIANINTLIE